ncbi:Protein O-mannosyl-transferase TMTC2, partial [Dissostichus eleginoides]
MDVVWVVVSEGVLRLGRVRMTYLFVIGPGLRMFGSDARLSSALSKVYAEKHKALPVALRTVDAKQQDQSCLAKSKRKNVDLLLNVFVLAAWGVVLLAGRFYWMGNKPPNFSNSDNPAADSPSLLTRMLTFSYLPAANFWLLLCPDMLSFDWSMDALPLIRRLADWRNLYTAAFYLGLFFLAWFSLWTQQTAKGKETNGKAHHFTNGRNGNSLLAIPFLPATNLFFYVGFVIAERVLYIPSMGFCLLVAVGMRSLYVRLRRRSFRTMLVYCSATVVLLFSVKTVLRNKDWQNEEMLYKSGIYVNPAKAWGNLGNVLKSQGEMEEAEQAYRNALYYRSNMADMLYNLGLLLQESNKFSEALHYYKLAIGSRPTLASAYLNTGIILMNQGRLDESKRTFLTCADIPDENLKDPHAHKSSVTSCLYNLGKLLHEQGHQEEALTVFKEAIQKMPRQFAPQSLYNMMDAKEQQLSSEADLGGNLHPAGLAPALSAGLRNVPFRGAAFQLLGFDVTSNCTRGLHQTDKLTDAEHWYRESLRAKPDHIPAHLTYGKLLAMTLFTGGRNVLLKSLQLINSVLGQKTEAERYFLKAIQLDPTKGNCYMHYGVHLRFTALSGSNNSNSSRTRNKTRTFREEHFHLKETDPS